VTPSRAISAAMLLTSFATLARAQTVRPSASIDLAAIPTGEVRVSVEPAVFGRTTVGLLVGRWWGGGGATLFAPTPEEAGLVQPASGDAVHPVREYMADLYVRVYPKAFSGAAGLRVSGYLGAFLGFDERERDQVYTCGVGYACPLAGGSAICACPLVETPGTACPCPPTPAPQVTSDRAFGVEPGVELGIRAMPTDYLMLELGTWARLITFPDPTGRFEEGQIDPRLTVSVGVRW